MKKKKQEKFPNKIRQLLLFDWFSMIHNDGVNAVDTFMMLRLILFAVRTVMTKLLG